MAHKKGQGSSRNGRDSNSQRRGMKVSGGQQVTVAEAALMRTLGKAMYGLIGIPKGDAKAGWEQWGRNYKFFDAPVGIIFTIDKELGPMSYVDLGIFAQSLMLSATSRGLSTCAQGAWNQFWTPTKRVLGVPEDEYIVFGISLGYEDTASPVNSLVSEREPVANFATWHEG